MRGTRNIISVVGIIASLVIALVVSMGFAPSANAASTSTSAAASAARVQVRSVGATYDYQILYWTNVARRQHGLRPLKAGPCVDRFAESWTSRMAARGFFSHQRLRPVLRRCHRHMAGENIARSSGSWSAYQVVQAWMRSPGHRHNILNRRYKALGVSAWRSASGGTYITQDFAG
jgi:uncharacterized protein YkwD